MTADIPTSPARQLNDRLLSAVLLSLMGSELLWLVTRSDVVEAIVGGCILHSILLTTPRFGIRETYLMTIVTILSALVWFTVDEPIYVIAEGARQAAFLMSFVLLVGLIKQAAQTSRDVKTCGEYLTNQPPGRRYVSIFLGTHYMSHVFNLGIIALIAPLIMKGTEDASDPRNPIRQRRQISAMLTGFGWGVVWSPTAIAPLALLTLLPGAERIPWMFAGFLIALVVLLAGWAEDKARWKPGAFSAPMAPPPFPKAAFAGFGALCLVLLFLTLSGMAAFDQSVVFGLMLASPIILVGWLMLQNRGDTDATKGRVAEIYRTFLPNSAPIGVSLACSGFIGRVAAHLTPSQDIAEYLNIMAMSGWLFMLGLSLLVMAMSWLALSPIMLAVFLGAVLAELPAMPIERTWAALAISSGWALSMMTSPFATTVLLNTQITGIPGLTYVGWNWRFSIMAIGILAAAYWMIDVLI